MKGNVKINIPKKVYHYGDLVSGYIDIIAKKHIEVEKVEVEFKAYKKQKVQTKNGTQYQNIWIFRNMQQISGKDTILAGSQRSLSLKIDIPNIDALPYDVSQAIMLFENTNKWVSGYSRRSIAPQVYWKLAVYVTAEGLDLYRQESLLIQTKK